MLTVSLTGCLATKQTHYLKPNVTQQQKQADLSQCIMQARVSSAAAGYTNGFYELADMMNQRDMCMSGKGYSHFEQ